MKIFFHISHLFEKAEKSFLVLNLKLHLKLSFQVFSHLPTSRVLNYWRVILYDSLYSDMMGTLSSIRDGYPNKWSDFESFWYKVSIKVFFEFQNDQKIFYQNDFIKWLIAMEPRASWNQKSQDPIGPTLRESGSPNHRTDWPPSDRTFICTIKGTYLISP